MKDLGFKDISECFLLLIQCGSAPEVCGVWRGSGLAVGAGVCRAPGGVYIVSIAHLDRIRNSHPRFSPLLFPTLRTGPPTTASRMARQEARGSVHPRRRAESIARYSEKEAVPYC